MSELQFRLPDVGEGLSEGEIVEWHVAPGDRVARDQVLVDVQTDKSVVELPAPSAGVIRELRGAVGDVLEVGAVLVVMDTDSSPEGSSAPPADAAPAPDTAPPAPAEAATAPAEAAAAPRRRVLAAPATRKLALELGVDLAQVQGSGPGGRVSSDDVRGAAEHADGQAPAGAPVAVEPPRAEPTAPPPEGHGDEVVALRGLRRQIARTMTTSWRHVPHITDLREVDATELVRAHARLRARLEPDGVRLTFLPLFVKAITAALARHPKFNASLDLEAETVTYHGRRNIGLATATPDGLIVPVLHDADRLSLAEIARQVDALATAARSRAIAVEQTSAGTFTVTNTGSYGGWLGTPIIRPPESAIAGFGRIREGVVARDGAPAVCQVLPVSVAADHRLIDGDDLGVFVTDLAALLSDPVLLLAEHP